EPAPAPLPAKPRIKARPRKAHNAAADEAELQLALINQLVRQHNYEQALNVAGELAKSHAPPPAVFRLIAIAQTALGNGPAACAAFRRYVAAAPDAPDRATIDTVIAGCQ